jgi:hypothetical protein
MVAEVGSQLLDIGINEDSGNRFGGAYASAAQGGMLRFSSWTALPNPITFLTRPAGSTAAMVARMVIDQNGNVCIGGPTPTSPLQVVTLPTYATNALAIAGGLTAGAFFKVNTAGEYSVHVVV